MGRHAREFDSTPPLRIFTFVALLAALWPLTAASAQDIAPLSNNALRQGIVEQAEETPPDNQGGYSDPIAPFNEQMFQFNLKLDDWVLHPVATTYASVTTQGMRTGVTRFFQNANVIPRVANNVFQLRFKEAGSDLARFGINTTLGVAGFFDPANAWFGLKDYPDDFGLTLRYYGVPAGPYLMLPFVGPSTVTDAIGIAADGAMNPMGYFLPWYITLPTSIGKRGIEAVNYRAQHLELFEDADAYAVDLYGAVQDVYLKTRERQVEELRHPTPTINASDWILIESPSTEEFPHGNLSTPKGQWQALRAYPNEVECNNALERLQTFEELRPVDCIKGDSKEYAEILGNAS